MAANLLANLDDFHRPLYQNITAAIISVVLFAGLFKFYSDPLRHIPGPFIARLTPLWLWKLTWSGIECRTISALHQKYGPVVRIAPNEVDVSDGAALGPIYIKNGGFPKSPNYQNFDIDGFATIFSDLDSARRAIRAKAVAPLFAQQAIVKGKAALEKVADAMVTELERKKANAHGRPVDVMNLFRALAIDTVTLYLFGHSFDGVGAEHLSATAFIDNFVAGGRFFYLPGWLYDYVDYWATKFDKEKLEATTSSDIVTQFATKLVDKSIAEDKGEGQTYQSRLLAAGISREETIAQVVDVMFAGTDAHGRIMSVISCYLAQCLDK